jgi:hypothetical protein
MFARLMTKWKNHIGRSHCASLAAVRVLFALPFLFAVAAQGQLLSVPASLDLGTLYRVTDSTGAAHWRKYYATLPIVNETPDTITLTGVDIVDSSNLHLFQTDINQCPSRLEPFGRPIMMVPGATFNALLSLTVLESGSPSAIARVFSVHKSDAERAVDVPLTARVIDSAVFFAIAPSRATVVSRPCDLIYPSAINDFNPQVFYVNVTDEVVSLDSLVITGDTVNFKSYPRDDSVVLVWLSGGYVKLPALLPPHAWPASISFMFKPVIQLAATTHIALFCHTQSRPSIVLRSSVSADVLQNIEPFYSQYSYAALPLVDVGKCVTWGDSSDVLTLEYDGLSGYCADTATFILYFIGERARYYDLLRPSKILKLLPGNSKNLVVKYCPLTPQGTSDSAHPNAWVLDTLMAKMLYPPSGKPTKAFRLWSRTSPAAAVKSESPDSPELFLMYPNPFSSELTVQCATASALKAADVIDALGRNVYQYAVPLGSPVSHFVWHPDENLPNGLYIVTMHYPDRTISKPIVLQR